MLNPKIQKHRKPDNEHGLFSGDFIPAGEFIWMSHPDDSNLQIYLTMEEIQKLPKKQRDIFFMYCYQVDVDLFSGYLRMADVETDDANFMNHSCDPNCWYNGDILVARRLILPGEEITYDYATDTTAREWGFRCNCGSPACRGTVTSEDWKKIRHIYDSHFIDYMNKIYCGDEEVLLKQKIG